MTDRAEVVAWVQKWGGAASSALLDPTCEFYTLPGVDGAIGYRAGHGCAVAIGEPVCPPSLRAPMADAFRAHVERDGAAAVFAAASAPFAAIERARGFGAVEFGAAVVLDPRKDPQGGGRGRELRKKVHHARRAGAQVSEYARARGADPILEAAIEDVVRLWDAARHGPQVFIARVRVFDAPEIRRWFYARAGDRVVGVLALLAMESRGGWLFDHLLAAPHAPPGTTELLVTCALETLGREGCAFATFGPAPTPRLGAVFGLPRVSRAVASGVFAAAGSLFRFGGVERFRLKFQAARLEPSYVLVHPAHLGIREALGLLRAFNVQLR